MTKIIIDPITRLEGHLKIEVTVEGGQVVDAKATGTLFRGMETILRGRPPADAAHLTQRVCGVCPVSHGLAAVLAQDRLTGVATPDNARIMRNLVLGANYLQSHILHFYHLALQDYVDGPNMHPWQPSWRTDKRLSAAASQNLVNHYITALDMRRKAHELGALFGGRMPHPPTYLCGGFTTTPRAARITSAKAYLNEIIPFIQQVYLPDVDTVAQAYPDYDHNSPNPIGQGYGNLLAYGAFELDATGATKLFRAGSVEHGSKLTPRLTISNITEQVTHSWYQDSTNNLRPASGATLPQYPKADAYSWLKAPRYAGQPYEVGPLARMWVNGDYRLGISVMDRHRARAREALKVAQAMRGWLDQLNPTGPVYARPTMPASGAAYGLTEAPRGALGHWLSLSGGLIANYQIVTPTCWNASPRDTQERLGPLEKALIGAPVTNLDEPISVLRVIHSFDPCLSCAVHVIRPKSRGRVFLLSQHQGGVTCAAAGQGAGER